jgi:hypothetical protein
MIKYSRHKLEMPPIFKIRKWSLLHTCDNSSYSVYSWSNIIKIIL